MRDSFTENAKGNNAGLAIVGRSESSEAASDHPITPLMEGLAERGGGERSHSNAARLPRRTPSHDRASSSGPDRRQSTEGSVESSTLVRASSGDPPNAPPTPVGRIGQGPLAPMPAGGLPSRQQSDTRDRAARIALIMDNKPVDGGAGAIRTDRRQPGVRSESAIEVVDGGTGTKRSPNTGPPERSPNTGPGRTSSKDLHSDRTRVPPDAPMSPIALQRNSRTVLPGSGPGGVAEGGGGPQTPVSENLKRSSRGSVERTSESPPRTQTPLVSSGTRFYANVVNKQVRHREGLRVRAVGSVRCGNPVGV